MLEPGRWSRQPCHGSTREPLSAEEAGSLLASTHGQAHQDSTQQPHHPVADHHYRLQEAHGEDPGRPWRPAQGVHPRVVMEVGHSAVEMTLNVYGHVNLDTQRAALDHLDEQLSG